MREQTVVQALETIDRRVNDARRGRAEHLALRSVERPDHGGAPRRDRGRARQGHHRQDGLRSSSRSSSRGPAPTREALLQAHGGQVPADMEVVSGAAGAQMAAPMFYLVRQGRGGHRRRPARRLADDRREQPSGGPLPADQRRRPQVRQGHRREHQPACSRSSSTAGSSRRRASRAGSPTRAGSPAASPATKSTTSRSCCGRARCRPR